MPEKYKIEIERDGQDCDGPINHGVDEHVGDYSDLALAVGFATLRHKSAHLVEADETGATYVFSNSHDEGFSRTTISFRELNPDEVDDEQK